MSQEEWQVLQEKGDAARGEEDGYPAVGSAEKIDGSGTTLLC